MRPGEPKIDPRSHVAKVGHDIAAAYEYGIDLILDALEQRRNEA